MFPEVRNRYHSKSPLCLLGPKVTFPLRILQLNFFLASVYNNKVSNNENFKPNGANKCNYVPNTFEKKNLLSTKQLHFVGKKIPNHTMS